MGIYFQSSAKFVMISERVGRRPEPDRVGASYQSDVPYQLSGYTTLVDGTVQALGAAYRVTPTSPWLAIRTPGSCTARPETSAGNPISDSGCRPISATLEYCEESIGGVQCWTEIAFGPRLWLPAPGNSAKGLPAMSVSEPSVGLIEKTSIWLSHVVQRIEEVVRTIECQSNGSSVRVGQANFRQGARAGVDQEAVHVGAVRDMQPLTFRIHNRRMDRVAGRERAARNGRQRAGAGIDREAGHFIRLRFRCV